MKKNFFSLDRVVWLAIFIIVFAGCNKKDLEPQQPEKSNTETTSRAVTALNPIKVMSFNVRHDDPNDPRSLDQRKSLILEKILSSNSDIIGVQEVSDNWFESWLNTKMTEAGFAYYRPPGVGSPKIIYYRASLFNLAGSGSFTYPPPNSTVNGSGAWVYLIDKFTPGHYFVLNNHWPYDSKAARIEGAKKSKEVVDANAPDGVAIIALGDLNAKPGTDEIDILKTAGDNFGPLKATHDKTQLTYHGWGDAGISKIDHIFVSQGFTVLAANVMDGKVDGYWPSDHWPINVKIQHQ